MNCPKCGEDCQRDEVDIGVGIQCGPWGCPRCGWSEDDAYDLSEGQNPVDDRGGAKDHYGGYHPSGASLARAYRLAEEMAKKEPSK